MRCARIPGRIDSLAVQDTAGRIPNPKGRPAASIGTPGEGKLFYLSTRCRAAIPHCGRTIIITIYKMRPAGGAGRPLFTSGVHARNLRTGVVPGPLIKRLHLERLQPVHTTMPGTQQLLLVFCGPFQDQLFHPLGGISTHNLQRPDTNHQFMFTVISLEARLIRGRLQKPYYYSVEFRYYRHRSLTPKGHVPIALRDAFTAPPVQLFFTDHENRDPAGPQKFHADREIIQGINGLNTEPTGSIQRSRRRPSASRRDTQCPAHKWF